MDYKKMSYVSGIVVFFAILILFVSIIWLSEKRIFFTDEYSLFVKFSDVIGLQDKTHVFLRGYRVGTTKDVRFDKNGIIVRIDIKKKYQIPSDSHFEINTVNFLGEKAVTIIPGDSATYLKAGDFTIGENKDIMIQLKDILSSLKGNMDKGEIHDKIQQFSQSISSLQSALNKINREIDKVDVQSYNEQIRAIGQTSRTVKDVLKKTSDSLSLGIKKFNLAMDDISLLSEQMQQVTGKVNRGEGSIGQLMNNEDYVKNFNATLKNLQALIEDVKKNPKKYIHVSVF